MPNKDEDKKLEAHKVDDHKYVEPKLNPKEEAKIELDPDKEENDNNKRVQERMKKEKADKE
jgi:hypothetical protein